MVLPRAAPALLIKIVGLPKVDLTASAALLMEEVDARSTWKYLTVGGAVKVSVYFAMRYLCYPRLYSSHFRSISSIV